MNLSSKALILALFTAAACTVDGDPVESGTDGDTDVATSASSMSSSSTGSMSASSTTAGTASSTSASTSEGSSSESGDSGSGDSGSSGHSATMTSTGGSESGSTTGELMCIEMDMMCGEGVAGDCCEGTQCVNNGLAPTCQRCGVADDPCDPVAAPCCAGFECVQEGPGQAGMCVEE
jgi:hypothetical protein